ncbi:MAG TPA: glycosyltransferase family protein [Ferruginibacter sp.]|nr:glycosyltransferase family protein [Ferruginibacter sp.]HMP20799.1 glycosyltransferase family protein [Ferruginibacter sp.]
MKVLYAIQGTGNGHVSRANEILPILQQKCELDVLLSGTQADVGVNFPVKYRLRGMSFIFGKKGGVDVYKTMKQMQSKKFIQEIKDLPVENYDLVINDFEPVSAWACRSRQVPCVAMSHQFAVLHKNAPRPASFDPLALLVLKYYAPCKSGVGFHFKKYGDNIFTPVIRSEIRHADVKNKGHYTVYLPAYDDDKIIGFLSKFKGVQWQVFSKHTTKFYKEKNCLVHPVHAKFFTESFINCEGVLCGAGFETPAEALYMQKKVLVVPMKQQYEQHCNAAGAASLGVPVIKSIKSKHFEKVEAWLNNNQRIEVDYKDETESIINNILTAASQPGMIPAQPKIEPSRILPAFR